MRDNADDKSLSSLYFTIGVLCRVSTISQVFHSFALITTEGAALFVDDSQINDAVREHLSAAGVVVRPYAQIFSDLSLLSSSTESLVWIDPDTCSHAIFSAIGAHRAPSC